MRHDELIVLERILRSMYKMQPPPEPHQLQKTLERVSAFLSDSQRLNKNNAAAGEEAPLARSSTISNRDDDAAAYGKAAMTAAMRAAAAGVWEQRDDELSSGGACIKHLQDMIRALKKGGHCCIDMRLKKGEAAKSCPTARAESRTVDPDPCCLDSYMRRNLVKISLDDGSQAMSQSGRFLGFSAPLDYKVCILYKDRCSCCSLIS